MDTENIAKMLQLIASICYVSVYCQQTVLLKASHEAMLNCKITEIYVNIWIRSYILQVNDIQIND